jgi:hypothetical protein
MTLKKQNSWKLLSIGLLGVIAIGLITPIDAKPAANNDGIQSILDLLLDSGFGLSALSSDVSMVQTTTDDTLSALTYVDDTFNCVGSGFPYVCSNECDENHSDRVVAVLEYNGDGDEEIHPNVVFYDNVSTESTTFEIQCLREANLSIVESEIDQLQSSVDDATNDIASVQTTADDIFGVLTYVDDTFNCVGSGFPYVCSNECDESVDDRVLEVVEYNGDGDEEIHPNVVFYDNVSTESTTFEIQCLRD